MAEADPPPPRPARRRRAVVLFTLGALGLAAIAVALLSFDAPLVRRHDPETDNAYVGGDVVPLAARVGGYLTALPIADNQLVHAGDALAQIDDADYRAQLDQARAMAAAAAAQLQSVAAQQTELTAEIGQAQTQEAAQRTETVRTGAELIRQERLINTDVGVRRTLEQAQADQRRTEAAVESAHAMLVVRQKQAATLAAQYQQAAATVQARQADVALATPVPATRQAALALVPAGNFDLAQARSAFEASRQGIDIARAGLLPRLSLDVRGTRDKETDVQQLHQRDNLVEGTVQFTVPLYQGGGPAAETRQAKEATARSALQIDVVLRQVRQQAQTAWDQLEAGRTRMAQARASIEANSVAVRGVARQQSVGARTLLEVLNAQQELLTAEVSLARATHDEEVAELGLLAVTGRLTAAEIGLHVPLYDPQPHYDATRDRWGGLTPAP